MTFLGSASATATFGDYAEIAALHAATKNAVIAMQTALDTRLATIDGRVDGLETLIGATNTALGTLNTAMTTQNGYLDGLEGKADQQIALLSATDPAIVSEAPTQRVGTRAYGVTQRIAVASASTSTGAIVPLPKGEVMVQADTDCFVQVGTGGTAATATTTTSIPLIAGEKFHLQAPTNQFIAVIRKSLDGFLYITPVA